MTTAPKDFQHLSAVSEQMNISGAPSVVISLMTGPLLVTLIGARALSDVLTQVGLASEELFRGERLPTLQNVPYQSDSMDDADLE
jgi:hypothetical protein